MSELLARCAMLHGMADALESLGFYNTGSEVYHEITKMGIDYIGADDV